MLKNLMYKIQRFLYGERGIVESVEIDRSIYYRDDFGEPPQKVRFRNPLGELVIKLSPIITMPLPTFRKIPHNYKIKYKTYKKGDRFP